MKLILTKDDGKVVSAWDSHDEQDQEFWCNAIRDLKEWIEPEDLDAIKYDINEQIDASQRSGWSSSCDANPTSHSGPFITRSPTPTASCIWQNALPESPRKVSHTCEKVVTI